MKTIIIGFSDGGNLFSKLIKFGTGSKISHTFIAFEEYGEMMVFQASGLTVNYENYEHFLGHAKIIDLYTKEVPDHVWDSMKHMQLKELGKPYSIREIFGYACVLICRKFGKKIKNPFYDGKHAYVCVELTLEQLNEPWNGTITPGELCEWCKINPEFKRIV